MLLDGVNARVISYLPLLLLRMRISTKCGNLKMCLQLLLNTRTRLMEVASYHYTLLVIDYRLSPISRHINLELNGRH